MDRVERIERLAGPHPPAAVERMLSDASDKDLDVVEAWMEGRPAMPQEEET